MEQENKYIYVVFAEVRSEEGSIADVLGVYDTEEQAQEVAEFEIRERFEKEPEEDRLEMKVKQKSRNWLYYEDEFDGFYRVDVWVFRKQLNRVDIPFTELRF